MHQNKKKSSYCVGFSAERWSTSLPSFFLFSHTTFADPPFCGLGQLAPYHCVDGEQIYECDKGHATERPLHRQQMGHATWCILIFIIEVVKCSFVCVKALLGPTGIL